MSFAKRLQRVVKTKKPQKIPGRSATVLMMCKDESVPQHSSMSDIKLVMVQRAASMRFMPNLYVFPGGKTDRADFECNDTHSLLHADYFIQNNLLLTDNIQQETLAERFSAIREVFEETGILLATPSSNNSRASLLLNMPYSNTELRSIDFNKMAPENYAWDNLHVFHPEHMRFDPAFYVDYHEHKRRQVLQGDTNFRSLLYNAGLSMSAEQLIPFHRFITPKTYSSRFDTYFYLAPLATPLEEIKDVLFRTEKFKDVEIPIPDYTQFPMMRFHQVNVRKPHSHVLNEVAKVIVTSPEEMLHASTDGFYPDYKERPTLSPPTVYSLQQLVGRKFDEVVATAKAELYDVSTTTADQFAELHKDKSHSEDFPKVFVGSTDEDRLTRHMYINSHLDYSGKVTKFYPRYNFIADNATLDEKVDTLVAERKVFPFFPLVPLRVNQLSTDSYTQKLHMSKSAKSNTVPFFLALHGDVSHPITNAMLERLYKLTRRYPMPDSPPAVSVTNNVATYLRDMLIDINPINDVLVMDPSPSEKQLLDPRRRLNEMGTDISNRLCGHFPNGFQMNAAIYDLPTEDDYERINLFTIDQILAYFQMVDPSRKAKSIKGVTRPKLFVDSDYKLRVGTVVYEGEVEVLPTDPIYPFLHFHRISLNPSDQSTWITIISDSDCEEGTVPQAAL